MARAASTTQMPMTAKIVPAAIRTYFKGAIFATAGQKDRPNIRQHHADRRADGDELDIVELRASSQVAICVLSPVSTKNKATSLIRKMPGAETFAAFSSCFSGTSAQAAMAMNATPSTL